jgi:signal transduction histidine kinase
VRRYWLTLAGVAAVSLGAATLIGVTMARWVTRPLGRVRDGAEHLGAGQLDARVPDDGGPPEVRSLARTFNAMAGRIDQLVRSQEAFVADASHQLRTPLTALRLRLENLEEELASGELDADGRAAAAGDVDAALAESHRLSRLVDGLLTLARADRTDPQTSAVALDVDEVFRERVARWQPLAEEREVTLRAEPVTPLDPARRVRATPDRLAQTLDNLIANALEVAPVGSDVVLHVATNTHDDAVDVVELHVTDAGPGLSADQRERAFDRFWRAGTTRSDLSGSGLGLAIAQRLTHADGGTIELRPAHPTGIDAVVALPAG